MQTAASLSVRSLDFDAALALAPGFADLRYTQHPAYAVEAATRVGAACEFLALAQGEAALGFAAVRVKHVPLAGGGLAYLHGGPATLRHGARFDPALFEQCLQALAQHYGARGMVLRVSSPLDGAADAALAGPYRLLGFAPAAQPIGRTILLDLRPDPGRLRAQLHRKWRGHLVRAEGSGLAVTRSSDPLQIAAAQPLLSQLSTRKGFAAPMQLHFYSRVAGHLHGTGDGEAFVLHSAHQQGELVAFHLGSFTGDRATYLLGAASPAGRETRAAYLLQWAAIEYAQRRGLAHYDLGGIDPGGNPDVYHFKARIGGAETHYAAPWERPGSMLGTGAVRLAEWLRGRRR